MILSFCVSLGLVHTHSVYHWLLGAVEVCWFDVLQAGCDYNRLLVCLGPILRHRLDWNQIGRILLFLGA